MYLIILIASTLYWLVGANETNFHTMIPMIDQITLELEIPEIGLQKNTRYFGVKWETINDLTLYILSARRISRGMELLGNWTVVEYFRSLSCWV